MTKLQFQHQTSGHDSNQPVEFALAEAEQQSHKVNVKRDNIWGSFMALAEFWSRSAGAELGYHLITARFISPKVSRSPLTEAGWSIFRQNIISSHRELPRQGKLISHTTKAQPTDGKQELFAPG